MGTLACLSSVPVMTHIVDKVLPLLGAVDSDIQRQGAVEALASVAEKLQFSIVPYIVLLVVPLLGKCTPLDTVMSFGNGFSALMSSFITPTYCSSCT
jgi:TATA-binding protein-associated factor